MQEKKGEWIVETRAESPTLKPVKGGWAAFGIGWAVHGQTKEEAVSLYHEAIDRHNEIDARVSEGVERNKEH